MNDWAERVAVITGAASGIGRAAVQRVLEQSGRQWEAMVPVDGGVFAGTGQFTPGVAGL